MRPFWRIVWIVARKDLAIEARSRELINTTLFFALSCVIIFAVSFVRDGRNSETPQQASCGWPWRFRALAQAAFEQGVTPIPSGR